MSTISFRPGGSSLQNSMNRFALFSLNFQLLSKARIQDLLPQMVAKVRQGVIIAHAHCKCRGKHFTSILEITDTSRC
jgi:hypothetical protein